VDEREQTRANIAMRRLLKNRWLVFVLRLFLGGLFVYAGSTKFINPQAFGDSIATFKMLPPQVINIVALGLPPFEVLVGLMLVSNWEARAASLAAGGLSIVFGIALGQALIRGFPVDCGCFGSAEPSFSKTLGAFGRAIFLMITSYYLFHSTTKERGKRHAKHLAFCS